MMNDLYWDLEAFLERGSLLLLMTADALLWTRSVSGERSSPMIPSVASLVSFKKAKIISLVDFRLNRISEQDGYSGEASLTILSC